MRNQFTDLRMGNAKPIAYGIDTDFRQSLLQGIALFRGIDIDGISDLLPQCGRIDVPKGHVLLSPDRENHCVYVVLSGRLTVHLGSLEAPKIADLGPGSCAGEMSLIDGSARSATVTSGPDGARAFRLSAIAFNDLIEQHPHTAMLLLKGLVARVRRLEETVV